MNNPRTLLLALMACSLMLLSTYSALAQSPAIVDAVDNDPGNHLWNCDTNRVPFNNQETDRSRCFTFRYAVPPGGISSATVHIALDTLGSLQDTDATIVAVDAPVEACAWGQGQMPGCVVLHGGFKGGEKSLNLDLFNLACDASVPNSAENQQLVRKALESGVLHMLLEDDTAVYSARLVLNGGPLGAACGTSEQTAAVAVATQAAPASSASTAPRSPLDNRFNPPQYLLHATGHTTPSGPVKDDKYLLYPNAPGKSGFFQVADGAGGTTTYSTDYTGGPYNTPREVCAAEGSRLGDAPIAPWNSTASFTCRGVSAPTGTLALLEKGATEFLTGTPNPRAPDLDGAATASVAGALALAVLAASNYLLGSNNFVQGAIKNALRQPGSSAPGKSSPDVNIARGQSAANEFGRQASRTDAQARDAGATRGSTGTPGEANQSAGTASTGRGDAGAGTGRTSSFTPESLHRGGTVSPGTPSATVTVGGEAGVNLSAGAPSGELGAMALDQSVEEGIASLPDASDLLKDKLVDKAEEREKKQRLQAESNRLRAQVAAETQTFNAASDALKRAVDGVGDYDTAYRAWRQANHELTNTRAQLDQVLKQLAALEPKHEA